MSYCASPCGRTAVRALGALSLLAVLAARPAAGQQDTTPAPPDSADLAGLDIDELARIRITSAARKPETVAEAAAAVTVLTREDIRRLGAQTLPEVFRVVPGLQVARVGGREWAINARGFNEQSSNKLLVLVDGRTVYSPIFAGVYWDALSVPIDEIDRIEVIRGPGGALWGANAVNGVINIITRNSAESRGGRVALAGGTWDHVLGSVRYGGRLGGEGSYRAYVSGRERGGARLFDRAEAADDWRFAQGGFRLDGPGGATSAWMVQGDGYLGSGGTRVIVPTPRQAPYGDVRLDDTRIGGGNLMGRWTRTLGAASELSAQAYYSFARRRQTAVFGTTTEHTVDLELQHRFAPARRHDVNWGVEYRLLAADVTGGQAYGFDPAKRTTHLVSGFAQDEIALVPDRLALTLGGKLEHNGYTGFEVEPSARLRWTPGAVHAVWAAVSRAVRTPSRIDADAVAISAVQEPRFEARLVGSDAFVSETMIAYEVGYRLQPHPRLSFDVAGFYNDYDKLRTLAIDTVIAAAPRPVVLVELRNLGTGRTLGAELGAAWRAAPWMRLRGAYAFLDSKAQLVPDAPKGSSVDASTGNNAKHQASLWASFDLAHGAELDVVGRYVSALAGGGIPEYAEADVRLGWRLRDGLELSLGGQDLLQGQHREFRTSPFVADPRAIERRGYAKVVWRF